MRTAIASILAAVALSGCALVTPVVDDLTGTTIDQRCPAYEAELARARIIATTAEPGSLAHDAAVAAIPRWEMVIALNCTPLPEPEPAVDSGSPP